MHECTPHRNRGATKPCVPMPLPRPTFAYDKPKATAATAQPKLGDTAFASLRSASHPKLKITIRGTGETPARHLRTRVEPDSTASIRDEFLLLSYRARAPAHITIAARSQCCVACQYAPVSLIARKNFDCSESRICITQGDFRS